MLSAYFPLTTVYGFHQPASTWVLRRYASTVSVDADGEPRTGAWAESPCPIFRDPRAQFVNPDDRGQVDAQRCVVFTQTKLRALDAGSADPRPIDVLFDVQGVTGEPGSAWVVSEVRGWRDALGWEAVLVRQGRRGAAPWA